MEHSDQSSGVPLIPVPRQSGMGPADVQRAKVMLALPWHKSTNPLTAFSLLQLYDKRRMSIALNFGDSFLAHSRNHCVDAFLASDLEWLLMVDDDMVLPCNNAKWFNGVTGFELPEKFAGLHAVDRLLKHGKTLVGGLYWGRSEQGKAMYAEGCNQPIEAAYARKGPYDIVKVTRWVATGCLLAHRTVFEDISKKFPRLAHQVGGRGGNWFSSSEHNLCEVVDQTRTMLASGPMDGNKAMRAYEMLERGAAEVSKESSLGSGEDVTLCRRAAAAGHQSHIDMGLICGHVSSATVYGPANTFPKQ